MGQFIEQWLRDRLIADSNVNPLIATDPNAAPRVYPVWAPEADAAANVYPFITFLRTSTERQYVSGAKAQSDSLPKTHFQINLWHVDYWLLKPLQFAARIALDGVQEVQQDGFQVHSCFVTNEYDLQEPIMAAAQFPVFGIRLEVEIHATEALPN